jgi:uncharacterized membrane protein
MSEPHNRDAASGQRQDEPVDDAPPAIAWWSPQNPGAPRTPEELAESLYGSGPQPPARRQAQAPHGPLHGFLDTFLDGVRRHWLAIVTSLLGALLGVALLAPLGYAFGLTALSDSVFHAYRFICGQTPSHSFYIAGYQACLCTRCMAIYTSMLLAGLYLALFRSTQIRPLNWKFWLLAMVPMALDGGTQLFGWRESNLALRLLTGAIFGLGTAWFLFPQIEAAARDDLPTPTPAFAPPPSSRA